MKKKKYLAIVMVMILCMSMLLTGCGIIDTIGSLAEGAADAIMGGRNSNNRDDDDDDEDDDDDDDDRQGSGSGNGHGNGGSQLAYVDVEEQYKLLVDLRNKWYEGGNGSNRTSTSYGVSDLDNNGRIELIKEVFNYYSYSEDYVVLEVNANCDGLNEVEFIYDGHGKPDITEIYYAYEKSDGYYYSISNYTYGDADVYYIDYYTITMRDCVITAELFKYCEVDTDTYNSTYYDQDGNRVDENEFYDIEDPGYSNYTDCVIRNISMQYPEEITYTDGAASDTDLYYFLEHGYNVFMDSDLAYGRYDSELTIYTDPNSAEYQALEDVVVLNEGAHGSPVRFTMSADTYFGVVNGYWNAYLEVLSTYDYCDDVFYNRAYELILNLDEENSQAVVFGFDRIRVDEENFGSHRGTYVLNMESVQAGSLTEDSRYVKALGIVAYEVYAAGSESNFTGNEDCYYKAMAEVVNYIYDVQEDVKNVAYRYYDMIEDSFFYWNWHRYYYDTHDSDYVIVYHESGDGCEIDHDPYIDEYMYHDGIVHYVVGKCDYSEAFEAYDSVDIRCESDGTPYMIDYSFIDDHGNTVVVSFDIYGDSDSAFGIVANYIGYYEY